MKDWFSLDKLKAFGMDKLIICLLIGVFLLVICIPTSPKKEEKEEGVADGAGRETMTEIETLEQRLETMLEQVQGVGQVEVMITVIGEYNQIEGVVVVAEGADAPSVRQDIIETAQALFPIAAHKIKVCKMVESSGGMK
ncbi:MAG: hypothetical protein NC089_04095 [Bacteroides sp.]|nr:hypothetical protein [Bacteroides sp.]MCM1548576.1 hypothetical protein [Clostridium sp.]